MANIWKKEQSNTHDVILQTKEGFLLKFNSSKFILTNYLEKIKLNFIIIGYTETDSNVRQATKSSIITNTHSEIIANVEQEIGDKTIMEFLTKQNGSQVL